MRYNKLSLNYSKTTYMLLNSNLSQSCNFNVKINDNKIKHTTCTKYLGVYIDQHLSWTDHIHYLEMKLSRSVAMFYRIRYYLSNNALRSVYYSLTYSHLQYAIDVWGGAGKTALNRLNVLHNKVLRAMTYSSHKSRVSPLYRNVSLLKINYIHILEIGKFMHNLHWGRIPVNFDNLFTSANQAHSHATRAATRGGYIWQLTSTVKGKRSLKHLGPKSGTPFILLYVMFHHLPSKGSYKTNWLMNIMIDYPMRYYETTLRLGLYT